MTATAPSTPLTLEAPDGAIFEFEEVKTDSGQRSLGSVPILRWIDGDKALAYYGAEAIANILDGTSLRVSFQGTARRLRAKGESDDAIAKKQLEFRPGKREGGESTPVSRAARGAKAAAQAIGGDGGDLIASFMARIAKGEITREALEKLGA